MKRILQSKVTFVVLASIAMVALLVGAYSIVGRSNAKKRLSQAVPLSTSRLHYACKGDPESLACLQQHYTQITQTKGVTKAFDALKSAYAQDPSVKADCHQLAHVIGRVEAEKSSSISDVFSKGDQFCWAGYFHGAMETFLSKIGSKNLLAKLPTVCAQIKAQKPYSFYHYNCVHGMGHGIFAIEANDLMKTLSLCDSAGNSWEQQSCEGGAFMQNVMASEDPDDHTDYLKADQPMYPCTAVNEKYKQQCYLMQTSYALRLASQNFSTVFSECSAVDESYRDTCYQSLGRDASGNSISNVDQTKATCMLGATYGAQSNCIIGAVKDFVSYYHGISQATQLCQSLESQLSATCESTKTSYYSTF